MPDIEKFRQSIRRDLEKGATHWAHGQLLRTENEIVAAWRDGDEIEVKPQAGRYPQIN